MPVRLAVAVLVIATMTPLLLGLVGAAEDSMSSREAGSEARTLHEGMARAYYGGAGTVVTVELSIPLGQSLRVGGEGGDAYVIRVMDGAEVVDRVYMERPSVRVLGDVLDIAGNARVTIETVSEEGVYGVRLAL